MLDGFVVRRRPNTQGADVVDGHARIDRDAKTADAGVERQARTSRWR